MKLQGVLGMLEEKRLRDFCKMHDVNNARFLIATAQSFFGGSLRLTVHAFVSDRRISPSYKRVTVLLEAAKHGPHRIICVLSNLGNAN